MSRRRKAHPEPDDVLPVDLADMVLGEEPIAGGGAVLHDEGHLSLLEYESQLAAGVLMQGDGALEWPKRGGRRGRQLNRE